MHDDDLAWVPLGTLLVRRGLLDAEQLEMLLAEKEASGLRIGELGVAFGWVSSADVAQALAQQFRLPFRDLAVDPPDGTAADLLEPEALLEDRAVALGLDDGILEVGLADPTDFAAIERLRERAPCPVRIVVVDSTALLTHAARGYVPQS
jgi:hypothetical protein